MAICPPSGRACASVILFIRPSWQKNMGLVGHSYFRSSVAHVYTWSCLVEPMSHYLSSSGRPMSLLFCSLVRDYKNTVLVGHSYFRSSLAHVYTCQSDQTYVTVIPFMVCKDIIFDVNKRELYKIRLSLVISASWGWRHLAYIFCRWLFRHRF